MVRGRIKLAAVIAVTMASLTLANDWPFWRGPEQTGMTREPAPVLNGSLDGTNLIWKNDIGGRTTPVISGGRLFAVAPAGEGVGLQERVVCLDAATGKLIWEHRFNVFDSDVVENRLGWTAVVVDPETGNVYAHGTGGEFFCFNRDGEIQWKHSLTEEYGRITGYGGRMHTPIVDEDRVIISFLNSSWGPHAKPTHRYVAFDKRTGSIIWWAAPGGAPLDTTYACPVVAVIDGVRMLIAPNADGNVYGMLARTGEQVWSYKLSKRGLNSSMVVDGNYAYVAHSEENYNTTKMGSILCIDASKRGDITESGTVWRHDGYTVGYASPSIANGRLYHVSNSATLYCLDAKTGKIHWEYSLGRVGKGSPLVTADGVIYVGEQNGIFHILRDAGDECVSLDEKHFDRPDGLIDEIFGSPAVADGRLYFMTRYGTYCLGKPDPEGVNVPIPPGPAESDVDPATILSSGERNFTLKLVPEEVMLRPREPVTFQLNLFDSKGHSLNQWIGVPPGGPGKDWSTKGVKGSINPETDTFIAADANLASAGTVQLKFAGQEAAARVRICPRLPIKEDFESLDAGSVPAGWIGVSAKAEVVEKEGGKVLRKNAAKEKPSPPFMRMRSYTMVPEPIGYTVQCDMMSETRENRRSTFLPDMGMMNCRYFLMLMGADLKRGGATQLRIESWSPIPRFRHDMTFEWKPDTWYTVKFQVIEDKGKARCRAKVWERGNEEPKEWIIDVVDPYPNLEGSPGLYSYSTGTTPSSDGPNTYFDNYSVTRN